jgi:hypothetical protein
LNLRTRRSSPLDLEFGGELADWPAGTTRYILREDLLPRNGSFSVYGFTRAKGHNRAQHETGKHLSTFAQIRKTGILRYRNRSFKLQSSRDSELHDGGPIVKVGWEDFASTYRGESRGHVSRSLSRDHVPRSLSKEGWDD